MVTTTMYDSAVILSVKNVSIGYATFNTWLVPMCVCMCVRLYMILICIMWCYTVYMHVCTYMYGAYVGSARVWHLSTYVYVAYIPHSVCNLYAYIIPI